MTVIIIDKLRSVRSVINHSFCTEQNREEKYRTKNHSGLITTMTK